MAHFLVVEDFPPMAALVATAIRREGHSVLRAGSVAKALSLGDVFDYAVLDVDLPDGDGIQLATQLLNEDRVESIVFFTACRDADMLTGAARIGLVIDKTAGYDCLMAAIRQVTAPKMAMQVAVGGSPTPVTTQASSRSGTRRKVD